MKKEKRPSPAHSRAELAYPSPFPAEGGGKERKKNWKEYTATVEDIQNFLMDRILLRHNVITGRGLLAAHQRPHRELAVGGAVGDEGGEHQARVAGH